MNEAYNSLLHPLRRAEYILEQNGVPISENDQLDDLEFISEIMEARESIDETADADELAHIVDDNAGVSHAFDLLTEIYIQVGTAKIKETLGTIERAVGLQDWVSVKEGAVRLKYLEGIGAAGAQKREEMAD